MFSSRKTAKTQKEKCSARVLRRLSAEDAKPCPCQSCAELFFDEEPSHRDPGERSSPRITRAKVQPWTLLAAEGSSAFPLLEHLGGVQPDELKDFLVA